MLDLQDLRFRYGRNAAVRGVSLALDPGDCYGFLGHNGAGKTTVLRLALGLLRPEAGSVHILGHDASREPRLARASVGALVERPGFHLHATAHQNLAWLARLQGMPRRLAAAEGSRALELLGLATAARRRVGTFSLGMRQRLGIAAALLGRPRLLLLDEPGNGLDPEGIADLRTLLRQLCADEGTAVLLSSHQLQELDGLCNRIGVLRDGAMVVEGDLDSLRQRLGTRHVVAGTPLPALARRLTELGLAPTTVDGRLVVELGDRAPGGIVRELVAIGDLTTFAPEPPTLEAIYLSATRTAHAAEHVAPRPATRTAVLVPEPMPAREWSSARKPLQRALGHELRTLVARRSTVPLLLAPGAIAIYSVLAYHHRIGDAQQRVALGELFSADAGSGHLAVAQALQAALPLLALVVLWLGSQSVAADLGADTLRNTLMRSITRSDALLAKLTAVFLAAGAGLLLLVLVAMATAAAQLGFHDLEEVSRHGDRQVLAAAADTAPVFRAALLHCVLPLLAAGALGLLASVAAKRPARALATAVLLLLGQEVLREPLGEHAGWLLSSHLPTGLRDDSALGFLAATARGAADAFWPWSRQAILAPLAWLLVATAIAARCVRRLAVP